MAQHRASIQPDTLSARLPALILAAVVLATIIVLLGAQLSPMAGLSPSGGVPTVTQTPDDPAAAQPWTMPKR